MVWVSLRGSRPVAVAGGARTVAQGQQAPAPAAQPPATPRGRAPIDLTGYWVSIVNEDWRWRMVTPPKGDVASVPLNAEGTKVANAWDPATDGSCLAYGAAGLMRIPTRLNITIAPSRSRRTPDSRRGRCGSTAPRRRRSGRCKAIRWRSGSRRRSRDVAAVRRRFRGSAT